LEIPLVRGMVQEYAERNMTAIWIGFQDRPDKIKAYAEKHGIRPVGFDRRNEVARSYGMSYGAGVIFIDSEGMVRKRIAKGFTELELREVLKGLL
jgi:cytochrome oxidase Cu insertion factor (SCO1/SenC/PrrC family)